MFSCQLFFWGLVHENLSTFNIFEEIGKFIFVVDTSSFSLVHDLLGQGVSTDFLSKNFSVKNLWKSLLFESIVTISTEWITESSIIFQFVINFVCALPFIVFLMSGHLIMHVFSMFGHSSHMFLFFITSLRFI